MPDDDEYNELLEEAVGRSMKMGSAADLMFASFDQTFQRQRNQNGMGVASPGMRSGAVIEEDLAALMDTGAPEPDPEALAREEALHRDRLLRQYDPEGLQDPEWVLTYADAFDRQKDDEYYADVAEGLTPKIYHPDELATAALDWLGKDPTGLSVRQGFERKKRAEREKKERWTAEVSTRSGGVPFQSTKIAGWRWAEDGRELPPRATVIDVRTGESQDVKLDDELVLGGGMAGYVVSEIDPTLGVRLIAAAGSDQKDYWLSPTRPEYSEGSPFGQYVADQRGPAPAPIKAGS